jgi:hypothetical protein
MSNRIDLTQFEDIPKQMEIEWNEHPIYGARYLIQISEPETPWVVGAVVPDFERYDDYAKDKAEQEKMAKLFAASPNFVAELKRCYDLIDAQKENREFFWGVVEKIHDERWADAVLQFVVEHHPSKWCDYTHCPLCDEETASE